MDEPDARSGDRADRPHYGGDHHAYSLIDQLGTRVDRALDDDALRRDPAFIERLTPVLEALLRYFDPEVEGFERLPEGGAFLVVGNHSGGIYMPDYWAFLLEWFRRRGPSEPLYSLGFDLLYAIPGSASLARKLGSVPASQGAASALLDRGVPLLVYPGGDADDYRPWTERHRVDLHGRTGFVQLALRHRVPVIPMVSHGSHDVIFVLSRGERLAQRLGFDRLRVNVMPIVAGLPWGIAPAQLPTWPLPAKVTVRFCEPLDWSAHGPDAADDPEVVRHCYEEILGRMQANLDELVESLPHPVLARVRTAIPFLR